MRSEKGNAAMAEFMTELGDVPQSIIDLQPKVDPHRMSYIGRDEAELLGLLSERPTNQQTTSPKPEMRPAPIVQLVIRHESPASSEMITDRIVNCPVSLLWCFEFSLEAFASRYRVIR